MRAIGVSAFGQTQPFELRSITRQFCLHQHFFSDGPENALPGCCLRRFNT